MSDTPRILTLEQAEAELTEAVYASTRILEDLEHAGLVSGNGHHLRQEIAQLAVNKMRERWKGAPATPKASPA